VPADAKNQLLGVLGPMKPEIAGGEGNRFRSARAAGTMSRRAVIALHEWRAGHRGIGCGSARVPS
jgi:hypothetical protein